MRGNIGKRGIALVKKEVLKELRRLTDEYDCYFDARTIAMGIKHDERHGFIREQEADSFLIKLCEEDKALMVRHYFGNGSTTSIYRAKYTDKQLLSRKR